MGISTHILDTALGKPAEGVPVSLAYLLDGSWSLLNHATTDADGRCKHLLPADIEMRSGIYRVHFATSIYYEKQQLQGLYPYVSRQHYHIPLLLTANGYTTYRGS
jgi:5-hydroxyisourate hydrolase